MDLFSKFTISHFIWYLVPGLGAFFFIIFPIVVFSPQIVKSILDAIGPVGLVLVCIIFGFIMDGLRPYRFKCSYKRIKSKFFSDLQVVVGQKINPYLILSNISDLARKNEMTGLNLHHAIWILHGHFSVLCFVQAGWWLASSLYIFLLGQQNYKLLGIIDTGNFATGIISIVLMIFFVISGARIMKISNEDQETTNNMFLDFAKQYKVEINKMLNISQ